MVKIAFWKMLKRKDNSMKLYIFGSETEDGNFVRSAKQSVYTTDNIEDAVSKFNNINTNMTFKHSYLVADFGVARSGLFKPADCDSDDDILPFLIVGEYDYHINSEDPTKTIRNDKIEIEIDKGICNEFHNNLNAVRRYFNLVNPSNTGYNSFNMYISYKTTKNGYEVTRRRSVCSSNPGTLGITKFKLSHLDWGEIPYERRKPQIFTLDKPYVNKITNVETEIKIPNVFGKRSVVK